MKALVVILVVSLLGSMLPVPAALGSSTEAPTPEGIVGRYPDARVYTISMEEYRQLEGLLQARQLPATIVLAQASPPNPFAVTTPPATNALVATTNARITNAISAITNTPPATTAAPPVVVAAPHTAKKAEHDRANHADDDAFVDLLLELVRTDWGNSDAAIVVFVVVGVTVVLAVVVYAGTFLYRVATGRGGYTYWWDLSAQPTFVVGSGDSGYMASVKLSSGFKNREARVGLVVEGGYLSAEIEPVDLPDRIDVAGGYLMAGAGVRWQLGDREDNPSFFGLELLAGSSSDAAIDLMSITRANLSFGMGSHTRLGLSLGSIYLGLDPEDGIVQDIGNYSMVLGLQLGRRF